MKIATPKTKFLVTAREPTRCKIVINGKTFDIVMHLNYLGIELCSYGDIREGIRKQAIRVAYVSGFLRDVVWRNKDMRITEKFVLIKPA